MLEWVKDVFLHLSPLGIGWQTDVFWQRRCHASGHYLRLPRVCPKIRPIKDIETLFLGRSAVLLCALVCFGQQTLQAVIQALWGTARGVLGCSVYRQPNSSETVKFDKWTQSKFRAVKMFSAVWTATRKSGLSGSSTEKCAYLCTICRHAMVAWMLF